MASEQSGDRIGTSARGRVVLVTGASAGIGKATAERLHRSGWLVTGASRRGTSSGGWSGMVMDVDSDDSVTAGVRTVLDEHGRLDAIVACAGWGLAGAVEQTPIADAKDQLETNFWGAVRLVQSALPAMRSHGAGRIVLVGSIGGLIGIPFQAFYSASKFALEGYGEALAYEVAPFGIEVCLVEPGNITTEFTASRRDVRPPSGDETYAAAAKKAVEAMERDEANGAPADSVAAAIEKVLRARHVRRRVTVGKLEERAGTFAKRLIPYTLFEKAAKSSLGV
ncbi:MAG: SDR family oxidoreductase [Acidimicrobiales bacterium]|jgi:NAD(P)-dependent dehydrogenase (short-subunit alcohol dehydrogenase family)